MIHARSAVLWVCCLVVVPVVTLAWHAPAFACTPLVCGPGEFIPANGTHIPANTSALGWRVPRSSDRNAALPTLMFKRVDGAAVTPVMFTSEVAPDGLVLIRPDKLEVGARYRLETTSSECTSSPVEFDVTPAAELPVTLGDVTAGASMLEQVNVRTGSGKCFSPLPAVRAAIEFRVSAEAEPWAALLDRRTVVDDQTWIPLVDPDMHDSEMFVFASCVRSNDEIDPSISERGLNPGEHTLRIEAALPGMDTLQTTDVTFRLPCAQPHDDDEVAANTGCSATSAPRASGAFFLCVLALLVAIRRSQRRL